MRAASCTRASISRAGIFWMVSASAMFSYAVSVSSRLESWKMKPSSSRLNRASSLPASDPTSRPPIWMLPLVGASMVARQLSSVDLPDPLGPMMPVNSPAATAKLTWSSACVTLPSRLRPSMP